MKIVKTRGCRLYLADSDDCLEWVAGRDKVGAVLTDPPYGIGAGNRSDGGVGSVISGNKHYGRQKWDLEPASLRTIRTLLDLEVPTVIWGGNYFRLPPSPCWLVWNKRQRDFTFADAELAWTNLKAAVRIFDYGRGALVCEGKQHPTQKPVPLMEWCLKRMRLDGGTVVLDPYMGSGTTGVACVLMGLPFVGVEINPEFFDVAVQRIRSADAGLLV